MERNIILIIAGVLSCLAALLHIACIIGGPQWYRFLGAGEQMAQMAENSEIYPTLVTFAIACILFTWGLYAFSGAGLIVTLPLLKAGLVIITAIYLLRGVIGLVLPFVTSAPAIHQNSIAFWVVSSIISTIFGICYLVGTLRFLR